MVRIGRALAKWPMTSLHLNLALKIPKWLSEAVNLRTDITMCRKRYKEPTHISILQMYVFFPLSYICFLYIIVVFIYIKIILFHLRMLSNIIIVFGRRLQHVSDPNFPFLLYLFVYLNRNFFIKLN